MTTLTVLAALASGAFALAGAFVGAWLLHCGRSGKSPVPAVRWPQRIKVDGEKKDEGGRLPVERA
jgi:hypothetical protein